MRKPDIRPPHALCHHILQRCAKFHYDWLLGWPPILPQSIQGTTVLALIFVAGSVNFFSWYLRTPPHPYLCQIECFYHIAAYYGWSEVHSMRWRWMKPLLDAVLIRSRSWSVASWLREVVRLCCVRLGTSQRIPTYKTIGDEGSFLFFLPQHRKQHPQYPNFDQFDQSNMPYQHCICFAFSLPNIV